MVETLATRPEPSTGYDQHYTINYKVVTLNALYRPGIMHRLRFVC